MALVLIATADTLLLDQLQSAVESQGHGILAATDGQDAHAQAVQAAPDLVLLDAGLPPNGWAETCELLRQTPDLSPNMVILIVSSLSVDPRSLERHGANGMVNKSISAPEVGELLTRFLDPGTLAR